MASSMNLGDRACRPKILIQLGILPGLRRKAWDTADIIQDSISVL